MIVYTPDEGRVPMLQWYMDGVTDKGCGRYQNREGTGQESDTPAGMIAAGNRERFEGLGA